MSKFSGSSSIHGINKLYTKSWLIKIIFSIFLFLSIYLCIVIISGSYETYKLYEVSTKIELIDEDDQIFPAVTICADSLFAYGDFNFQSCLFNTEDCDWDDFEVFSITKAHFKGFCLRFNSYKNSSTELKKLNVGYSNGLSLVYWCNKPINRSFVFISDNYMKSLDQEANFYQSPNNLYEYKLEKRVDEKLGMPYNKCGSVKDDTYRQANCVEKCVYDKIALEYNCSFDGYYMFENLKECNDTEQMTKTFNRKCYEECPRECVSILYTPSIMSIPLNGSKMGLKVFFGRSSYEKISQLPKMNKFDLVSGFGGVLGLFLGMSFFSFLEL